MGGSEVSTVVVKRSLGVSKWVFNIIRIYRDRMNIADYIAFSLPHSFLFFWFYFL
jgi:hypothetical protein